MPDRIDRTAMLTLILCGLVAAIDGFDTQAIGFTGRLIAHDIGFPPERLGWVFSAGLLGAATGAFIFGPLADRFGRKRLLVVTCLLVGLFTGLSLATRSLEQLMLCRLLTGIGLGGATPCFLGIGVETVPVRLRQTVAALLYACFPAGAIIGSVASQPILAHYGWRGVFVMGATLPLLFGAATAVVMQLGESGREHSKRIEFALLFKGVLRVRTPALWGSFGLAFSSIILLSLWMPALLQQEGVSPGQSGLLLAALNIGSVALSLCIGWLLTRFGTAPTLLPLVLGGTASWWLIAAAGTDMGWLVAAATFAGAMMGGLTTGLIAIASTQYPPELRATGIGWATGFSRVGQMLFPPIVGNMVAAGWMPDAILRACSMLLLVALGPLLILIIASRRTKPTEI